MLGLLLECAVRAALIAAGTAAVLLTLRVKRAAAKHAAWCGVTVWMLVLPAWTEWMPKAPIRILSAVKEVSPAMQVARDSVISVAGREFSEPRPEPMVGNWPAALLAAYLFGVALLFFRLAIGAMRARRLVHSARHREGYWSSPWCSAPVTVGWVRPFVILPESSLSWPEAKRLAVLAHEREHSRRRDPLVQLVALLNRALFWFHPLAWWLERRLSTLAEEACDAAVLARGHNPYDYSRYLLEIARTVECSGVRVNLLGMAMPGGSLPQRIRRILSSRSAPPLTRTRTLTVAIACLFLSSLLAGAALERQRPRVPARLAAVAAAAPAPQPATGRLLVLYFDFSILDGESQARAAATARAFVSSQMQPADRAAIMIVRDGRCTIRQDFTSDRDRLLQALSQVPGGRDASQAPAAMADALRAAVRMLGPVEGKKLLLLYARGTPANLLPKPELQTLIEDAIRANVAFYSIDINGPSVIGSVKPSSPGAAGGGFIDVIDGKHLSAFNTTLTQAVQFAYNVRAFQISRPSWLDTERFDIDLQSSAPATDLELRSLLQSLLAQRLHLSVHRETRVLPVYEMTLAAGGPKMPEVTQEDKLPVDVSPPGNTLLLVGTTREFAEMMSRFARLTKPVVDKTGLTGRYEFVVSGHTAPDLLLASVQQQFGFKLAQKNAPVEVLVIDRAEKAPVVY